MYRPSNQILSAIALMLSMMLSPSVQAQTSTPKGLAETPLGDFTEFAVIAMLSVDGPQTRLQTAFDSLMQQFGLTRADSVWSKAVPKGQIRVTGSFAATAVSFLVVFQPSSAAPIAEPILEYLLRQPRVVNVAGDLLEIGLGPSENPPNGPVLTKSVVVALAGSEFRGTTTQIAWKR